MESINEKPISFFRFEDLRIYQKSLDYSQMICNGIINIDTVAKQRLAQEFAKSSFDISLHIAEGSARSKSYFESHLKWAKTSIRQCVVYTETAKRLGIITDDTYEKSQQTLKELTKMIGALIVSIQRSLARKADYASEAELENSETNTSNNDLTVDF